MPDYEVRQTVDDYLNEIETVLDFTLKKINSH